jgi:hypothetical protein
MKSPLMGLFARSLCASGAFPMTPSQAGLSRSRRVEAHLVEASWTRSPPAGPLESRPVEACQLVAGPSPSRVPVEPHRTRSPAAGVSRSQRVKAYRMKRRTTEVSRLGDLAKARLMRSRAVGRSRPAYWGRSPAAGSSRTGASPAELRSTVPMVAGITMGLAIKTRREKSH